MIKSELVSSVAEKTGFTKTDCSKIVEGVLETIVETVASGEDIKIVGFGNFEVRERAARQGRNPKTNEIISIAAKKAVGFKVGKGFKDAVNR